MIEEHVQPAHADHDGHAAQQRDHLCGPFHAARVLIGAGVTEWNGTPIDQDLVALHAGSTLPADSRGPQVPAGAASLRDYRHELPRVDSDGAGTTPGRLSEAIESLSRGRLACVPLRGRWREDVLERLVGTAPRLGARLIANIRTGPLWASRPPLEALLAQLEGRRPSTVPRSEWDIGHFVELVQLLRGPGGALVVVRDSYPTLGWNSHHLQPPHALAAALTRGDGRQGGVLAVVGAGSAGAVRALAGELSLETELWDNGTQEVAN
jgi:hypothetical protein